MEKMLSVLFLIAVVEAGQLRHPKFPPIPEEYDNLQIKKVPCSGKHETEREIIIEEAQCGAPKDFFVPLIPPSISQEVNPSAVWVKRCIGTCDYTSGSSCVATEKTIRYVPVRVYSVTTNKQSCAVFPVEEHVACACCALSAEKCAPPRVRSTRKCACACPDPRERARCLAQGNMRWNRHKCICEEKHNYRRIKAGPFGMSRRSHGAKRGFK